MAFELPEIDLKPVGADAPLEVAIIQIRYRPKLAIEDPSRVAPFQEALAECTPPFDLFEEGYLQALAFQIGPEGVQQAPGATPERVWKFRSEDGACTIDLNRQSLSFEVTSYDSFAPLRTIVEHTLDAFMGKFGENTVVTRVGVRYVNKVSVPNGIGSRISPALVSPIGTELGTDLETSVNQLLFREAEGKTRVVHGLVEPERYVLDFDCFSEDEQPFETQALLASIERFHRRIELLFGWSVTREYLLELGAIEEGGG